jgi:transposase InsO family protein
MATYQIPAPAPMYVKGDLTENWKDFEDAWSNYILATGLNNKLKKADGAADTAGEIQVAATLCSVMGTDCSKIMKNLPKLTEANRKKPEKIIEALRDHFIPQRNVLFERFKFFSANQKEDTVDEYIVRLRQLAESCEFEGLKESLIRDRLVMGTNDIKCRDRLLQERPVPDLNKCAGSLRASELSNTHRRQMTDSGGNMTETGQDVDVNYVQKKSDTKRPWANGQGQGRKCRWCGFTPSHPRQLCKAKDAMCRACSKRGHFASVCKATNTRTRQIDETEPADQVDFIDIPFLGEIHIDSVNTSEFWSANVAVNRKKMAFKLDSGAGATIIGENVTWAKNQQLAPTNRQFRGLGGVTLTSRIIGMIHDAELSVGKETTREDIYVMENQQHNLLSKQACERLKLLQPSSEVYSLQKLDTSQPDFRAEYPELFTGLGCLKTDHHISLIPDAKPVCLYTARKVPHPLHTQVQKELELMTKQGVISPINSPTAWCSGMVCVPKKNGRVCVCVDLTALNKVVLREVHPMKTVDENLAKLKGSVCYSKLDANSGFWQIPLDFESRKLTTFVTPFGRFCYNRLPFGISSAPEIFQRTMSQILEGLQGVICHMDDILIHGTNQHEHDSRVRAVLQRLRDAGLTLNNKCEFSKHEIIFLGHIVSPKGIQADPGKIKAITDFPAPTNLTELQRFNGMTNQLAKFVPGLASMNAPIRHLLKKYQEWIWDVPQQQAFDNIKQKLVSTDILTHYDPNRVTIVAADACSNGLGAVLLQVDKQGNRRPVCYASRSLTEAETRYAVIEKEALAATWACEKFSDYILGLSFTLETDHKPLVPLLASTDLSKMPPRVLRFRLRMMRFSPKIVHVQGKEQITADALSRAPAGPPGTADVFLHEEVEVFALQAVSAIPATMARLNHIRAAQVADAECSLVADYCRKGWPTFMPHQPLIEPYWRNRQNLTIVQGLLMYNDLVIPRALRLEVLGQIHHGHLGITKCRARAAESVWWPQISNMIEDLVTKCQICARLRPVRKEPLMPSAMPSRAWERVGSDLFEHEKKHYLLVVDYYSRWIEIRHLPTTTSQETVKALKSIFALHGIPDIVMSDNGPQYSSETFRNFTSEYGFTHVTSSPLYPQSNGEAECAVQTAKNILKKNEDPYLGLLAYRSTPLHNGLSPSQLLMGRRLRTTLPTTWGSLQKQVNAAQTLEAQQRENDYRQNMQEDFNRRHRTVALSPLKEGDMDGSGTKTDMGVSSHNLSIPGPTTY